MRCKDGFLRGVTDIGDVKEMEQHWSHYGARKWGLGAIKKRKRDDDKEK